MKRTEILNLLIEKNKYESYLEIGLAGHDNYPHIKCKSKTGVDPAPTSYRDDTTKIMTSDAFFDQLDKNQKFDIIFIDGLHLEDQVDKDISNSLMHLSDNGVIIMHDCNPPTRHHARESQFEVTPAGRQWYGTVWRSFVKLRSSLEGYDLCVIDTDCGCGFIRKNSTSKKFDEFPVESMLDWNFFEKNREKILNLIPVSSFVRKIFLE